MTLRHMKILVAVYQKGSVTRAAEALHLSQPSVSLAIKELEDYYGVELFTRMGRRIVPTECGNAFYGYAVHVVSLMDELETQMRNWDTLGTVRIGATITIGTVLLPGLVKQSGGISGTKGRNSGLPRQPGGAADPGQPDRPGPD